MSHFSLLSWWKKRRPTLHVVQYTRRSCHLCDEAWALLQRYQTRYGFRLEAVDVDSDPRLAAEYGDWVPVVTVDGKVRFRGRVNEVMLKRLLDASQ
jgi:glutaredoxin